MQSKHKYDQAEGLRRLLVRPSLRVITVLGASRGLGASSVVVNLAAALASAGKKTLVLDENPSPGNVANMLALKPRYDLLNAVRDDMSWRDVVLDAQAGLQILPVAKAMRALPKLNHAERESLQENLMAASFGMDVVLVDATADGHSVCSNLSGEEPLLLILNATAEGIKESYALLKKMAVHNGRHAFDLVVNKARSEEEAHRVFDNMAKVAQQHLKVKLKYLGNIPFDENVSRAALLHRPVVDMIPHTPAASAFNALARNLMLLPTAEKEGTLNRMILRLLQQRPLPRVECAAR
jgi:flagellar biosynthesis protein FlhG